MTGPYGLLCNCILNLQKKMKMKQLARENVDQNVDQEEREEKRREKGNTVKGLDHAVQYNQKILSEIWTKI
jgi:hypothetical protein